MELEINGNTADLGDNIIAITRQSLDVENQSTRNIDITNKFNLPFSEINHKIFNSAYSINSNSDGLDKKYTSKLIDQFIMFNGSGILDEIRNTYPFQLIDSSRAIFDSMNALINKIGVDDQDILFNYSSYTNTNYEQNTLFVWPLVAMHQEKTATKSPAITSNSNLTFYRPLFRYSYILNRIFEINGWTLTYDNDLIDKLAISSNAKAFYVTSYQKTISQTITATSGGVNINFSSPEFNKVTGVTTSVISDEYNTIFRLRGNIQCDSTIRISIEATAQPSGKVKTSEHVVNTETTEIDIKTNEFSKDDTDTSIDFEVKVYGSGDIIFDDVLLYTLIEEQNLGVISDNNLIDYKVKAYDNMPSITQIDLFRDAMIRTHSIINSESVSSVLNLKSLKNLNKLNSYDWSDKYIIDSDTQKSKLSNIAQKNNLLYDNDDSIDVNLGKSSFQSSNEAVNDETDYFKFIFSASEDVEISGNVIGSMDVYDDNVRINDELNDRLFYMYEDSAKYVSRFSDISWENLKENYYKKWFESFFRVRAVECLFDLSKLDVLGHDFTKLVYVDDLKSYFYVYKIIQFTPNELTKVLMFKFL